VSSREILLTDWSTQTCPDQDYTAPERRDHVHLLGLVEGQHERGPKLTSRVVGVDGRLVTTKSGTVYRLGEPAPAFLDWLRERGLTYDETRPVKVKPISAGHDPGPALDAVVRALTSVHFNFATEDDLQAGISEALASLAHEREVALDGAGRIDFMVGAVGVEAKIKGGISALTRQLARYAQHPRVQALVVVTAKEQHKLQIPGSLNAKPVRVVCLRRGLS
jgi:hypothetical protein